MCVFFAGAGMSFDVEELLRKVGSIYIFNYIYMCVCVYV